MGITIDSFHEVFVTPPGSVVSIHGEGRTVVWLFGQIDLAVEPELDSVLWHRAGAGQQFVIDARHLTFCDLTLIRYIARITRDVTLTLRNPSQLLLDLLAVSDLLARVDIEVAT